MRDMKMRPVPVAARIPLHEQKRLSLVIDEKLWKNIKFRSIHNGTNLTVWIVQAILEKAEREDKAK